MTVLTIILASFGVICIVVLALLNKEYSKRLEYYENLIEGYKALNDITGEWNKFEESNWEKLFDSRLDYDVIGYDEKGKIHFIEDIAKNIEDFKDIEITHFTMIKKDSEMKR